MLVSSENGFHGEAPRPRQFVKVTNVGEAITAMNFFGNDASRSRVVVDGAELIRPPRYKKAETSFFAAAKTLAEEPCTACGAPWESEDGYLSSGRHSRRCVFCLTAYCSVCKAQYMEPHSSSLLGTNHAWACKGNACRATPAVQRHWAHLQNDGESRRRSHRDGTGAPPTASPRREPLSSRRQDDAVLRYAAARSAAANAAGMPGSTEPLGPRHTQEYCDL